jgi:hypothetical protein
MDAQPGKLYFKLKEVSCTALSITVHSHHVQAIADYCCFVHGIAEATQIPLSVLVETMHTVASPAAQTACTQE